MTRAVIQLLCKGVYKVNILKRTSISESPNGLWTFPELKELGLQMVMTGRDWDMALTEQTGEVTHFHTIQEVLAAPLFFMKQVHSTDFVMIDDGVIQDPLHPANDFDVEDLGFGTRIVGVDGLVTQLEATALGSTHADCAPVILWDPSHRTLANIHSGWRGTLDGFLPKLFDFLAADELISPGATRLIFGPMIAQDAYEVEADVALPFQKRFKNPAIIEQISDTKYLLSLQDALLEQARDLGVSDDRIYRVESSTHKDPAYHSYRRDGKDGYGLMMTFVRMI